MLGRGADAWRLRVRALRIRQNSATGPKVATATRMSQTGIGREPRSTAAMDQGREPGEPHSTAPPIPFPPHCGDHISVWAEPRIRNQSAGRETATTSMRQG